jgi:hypothetical protein
LQLNFLYRMDNLIIFLRRGQSADFASVLLALIAVCLKGAKMIAKSITVREACAIADISLAAFNSWARRGLLPVKRTGKRGEKREVSSWCLLLLLVLVDVRRHDFEIKIARSLLRFLRGFGETKILEFVDEGRTLLWGGPTGVFLLRPHTRFVGDEFTLPRAACHLDEMIPRAYGEEKATGTM